MNREMIQLRRLSGRFAARVPPTVLEIKDPRNTKPRQGRGCIPAKPENLGGLDNPEIPRNQRPSQREK
jgi:hypothetical protein